MNRAEILEEAKKIVTVDRAAVHGEAEDNFARIANGWTWWLTNRQAGPLDQYDVACMMAIFKLARMMGNKTHQDNAVDLAGYGAIAGELSTSYSREVEDV
jgi:hypothetical protein